jgi:TatD DNase family protein
MLFDSHCHLASPQLGLHLHDLLARASEAGVSAILNVGDTLQSSQLAQQQAASTCAHGVEIYASAGVHPQNALSWDANSEAALREILSRPRVVAVGEIGLDFFYDETHAEHPGATRNVQEQVLEAQLHIARELELPVVIHNREADDRLLAIVKNFPGVRGVFHCFASGLSVAEQVLEAGFHLGFGGMATFKNAHSVREVASWCPLDRMLIETDAPYLAPVPMRGKPNEPAFVAHSARFLAELRGLSLEEFGASTSRNARDLLGLEQA